MSVRMCVRNALAAAAAVAVVTALASGPASARPVSEALPLQAAPVGREVLLASGDRLAITPGPDGRSAVSVLPAAAGHDSLVMMRLGRRTEVIPTQSLPYLGRGLDPSLFDLGVLERAESGGRLPLRVTFRVGLRGLSGVTITRSGRGYAEGYLTVSSARAFGAALQRQFRDDRGRGGYGGDGLFSGGASIAVAGAPPAAAAAPSVRPVHTLTVTASDLSGKPDNGDSVWVLDADSLAAFTGTGSFSGGAARFRVPAGHYWVVGEFDSSTAAGGVTRLDFLPEFTVSRDTTVHAAERAARSEVVMATPRPALPQVVRFTVVFGDRGGPELSVGWFDAPGVVWVSPLARKPGVGTLQASTFEQLTSPFAAAGTPYVYNLDVRAPAGIIPVPHYRIRPSSLATVTERYYQEVRSAGAFFSVGAFPNEGLMAQILGPLPLPSLQVQYFSADPALLWSSSYFEFLGSGFPTGGQGDASYRSLVPGPQVQDWNRFPLHPQPNVSAGGAGGRLIPLIPSAIRAGNTLTLTVAPFSDNQPGHRSAGSVAGTAVTERYEIDQNGVPISRGSFAVSGIIPTVTLSRRPSVIRFTVDASRSGPSYVLSTRSRTVWTWRSRPQPAATVPPSWYCAYVTVGGQPTPVRRCAVQPMMTLSYRVHGLALNGTAPPGRQLIGLHAGHIQLAAAARVTGATAQVSCDGGRTWTRAGVSPAGGGNFRVAFSAPAGCAVTLRVSAADAAGSSITETITSAYQTGTRP